MLIVAGAALGWWNGLFGAGASIGGTEVNPSLFAAGSCVRLSPTSGNRHETVFLDAGHGGIDPGAVGETSTGRTIDEASLTLPIELDTASILRAEGFTVVVSRTRASTVMKLRRGDTNGDVFSLIGAHDEVAARDICANESHAKVLVGIYLDGGASREMAGSVTTYDVDRPFAASNRRLAELLQSSTLAALTAHGYPVPDNGVLDDSGMGSSNGNPASGGLAAKAAAYDHVMLIGPPMRGYFSTPSEMPGAVIEPLYVTNPEEGSIAASGAGERALAEGIAAGIERYLHR